MDPNGAASFKRGQCIRPTATVTFTEGEENTFPSGMGVYTPVRHSGRAALGFGDGHAELVKEKSLRRTSAEDDGTVEWSVNRDVYWYPYPGAPK